MSSRGSGATIVRMAVAADVAEMHAMVVELAVFEREAPERVRLDPDGLGRALFGERPLAEALVAEVDGTIAGHAIFHETFSTWEGGGIWLEDLYVRPAHRGSGAGAALFTHVAAEAIERGYDRFEWVALNWNEPALNFYRRFHAERHDDWVLHRLSGEPLAAAAQVSGRGGL